MTQSNGFLEMSDKVIVESRTRQGTGVLVECPSPNFVFGGPCEVDGARRAHE